jgi:peptide/nickel transport system substrate-binding protein
MGPVAISALSVAVVASGCSKTIDDKEGGAAAKTNVQRGVISYEATDNKGPAPPVEGAKKGGNLKAYQIGNTMVLDRNINWDPNSDPLRGAYPDHVTFIFTLQADQIAERLVADAPQDQSSLSWVPVPAAQLSKTTRPGVKERVVQGPTPYVWYLCINNDRIKDINVRKAINYALDKDALLKAIGGAPAGTPATTLLSPTVSGYAKFDVFNSPPAGDVAKAKEVLGNTPPPLVLAYSNNPRQQAQAEAIRKSMEAAGFKITTKSIDPNTYYNEIGRKGNPYDIYMAGWASDWPNADTVIPPMFDGRKITPTGNNNLSYFNNPEVNAEIDRIESLTDPAAAQKAWGALDKKIMTAYVPTVPAYYDASYTVTGAKVGNAFNSDALGLPAVANVYIK